MIRLVMTGIVSASLLVAATAQQKTQQKDSQQPDQTERANKLGSQADKPENGESTSEQNQRTELPELFSQLELNEEQKQQLLAVYRDSDQKSQEVWDRVQGLHRQAISMEACAIAAARLEAHNHGAHEPQAGQPANTVPDHQTNPAETGKSPEAKTGADDSEGKKPVALGTKENAEKHRAAKDTDDKTVNVRKANRREKRSAEDSKRSDNHEKAAWSGLDGDLNIVAIRVGIAQPDGRVREYLLTQPNSHEEADTNPMFSTHAKQLTQVWKEIHEGHEELVELEADTIVKVEAQLTEAQLQKLDAAQSHAANTSSNPNDDSRR